MDNQEGLNLDAAISTAYKSAVLQNVKIEPVPLGSICGIYEEVEGEYQIFLNAALMDDNNNNHDICDDTLYILMRHHNSNKKGERKVVTLNDLSLFGRLKEEVRRYERLAVEAFLKSFSPKKLFDN